MNEDFRETIYASYKSARQAPPLTHKEYAITSFNYSCYFANLLPERKNCKCLELGCGDGGLLYFLKEAGYTDITGVDISPEQVERARKLHDNIIQMNILSFLEKAPDAFYDVVFLVHVIEHFHMHEILKILHHIFRILKGNGRIILQLPCADGPLASASLFIDPTHMAHFTSWSIKHVLGMIGFQNVEAHSVRPVGRTLKGKIRKMLWFGIEAVLKTYDLIELGTCSGKTYTRSMSVVGFKASTG